MKGDSRSWIEFSYDNIKFTSNDFQLETQKVELVKPIAKVTREEVISEGVNPLVKKQYKSWTELLNKCGLSYGDCILIGDKISSIVAINEYHLLTIDILSHLAVPMGTVMKILPVVANVSLLLFN